MAGTLADEFLNDLMDEGEDVEELQKKEDDNEGPHPPPSTSLFLPLMISEIKAEPLLSTFAPNVGEEVKLEDLRANSVHQITTLLNSPEMKNILAVPLLSPFLLACFPTPLSLYHSLHLSHHLQEVDKYKEVKKNALADNDPEYDLIVRCNEMSVRISHHIADVHKVL